MTESEWDNERDPHVLLDHLFPMRGLDSTEEQSRSSVLYLLGCARLAWDRLPWIGKRLVELAERLVDRESIENSVRRGARELAEELTHCEGGPDDLAELERQLQALDYSFASKSSPDPTIKSEAWSSLAHLVYFPYSGKTPNYRRIAREYLSLELLHDVFPNPHRATQVQVGWQDRNVTGIARGMYANRDFTPMPLLADALQDAGCDNDYILTHCRRPGRHIRGCWLVEGVLRKRKVK